MGKTVPMQILKRVRYNSWCWKARNWTYTLIYNVKNWYGVTGLPL